MEDEPTEDWKAEVPRWGGDGGPLGPGVFCKVRMLERWFSYGERAMS